MIIVTFHCGGCEAKTQGTEPIRRKFHSMFNIGGHNAGLGQYKWETPADVVPEGWVASDQIGCTYCPTCADDIWPERVEARKVKTNV